MNIPKIAFQPAPLLDVATFAMYCTSLTSPIDSFLEDHIVQSAFYRVLIGDSDAGHIAIHDKTLLTQFHLVGAARRYGSGVLTRVRKDFDISSAFVPTCDEFFLSHAVDNYSALRVQGCFFVDTGPTAALSAPDRALVYREATADDAPAMAQVCSDFLDQIGRASCRERV